MIYLRRRYKIAIGVGAALVAVVALYFVLVGWNADVDEAVSSGKSTKILGRVDLNREDLLRSKKMQKAEAGESFITYIRSPENGDIAVKVVMPSESRYPEGAPVVVDVSNFFTPVNGFHEGVDATEIGAISVYYLWPGKEDPKTRAKSDGEFDYGGPNSLAALRDVIRFALDLEPNIEGRYFHELTEITPLKHNVGLYAFSHPGIVGTNVIALHGKEIPSLKYFVGRENPTVDEMYPLEIGYYTDERKIMVNPFYNPSGYSTSSVQVDYSTVGWVINKEYPEGRPYFKNVPKEEGPQLNPEPVQDFVLSEKGPTLFGKKYYSAALTRALADNGALNEGNWPAHLATPEEAERNWPYRTTVNNYSLLKNSAPNLKVMLVFAMNDHVLAAPDKPHIHHAYDGFKKGAGLWTRLNPDLSYVEKIAEKDQGKPLKEGGSAFTDNIANTEPVDWLKAYEWGYQAPYAGRVGTQLVPLAALAEMMDRTRANNWAPNLEGVLN